jgi:bacillithiol biosynthesis deacetylase BshB1
MAMNWVLPEKKRFLCVAPHPDDAELGMGGTLIKLARQGHHVHIVDMTNGEPTPNGSPELRQKEWTRASEIMGVARSNLRLKNREIQHTLEARHRLAAVIREQKPDVVFIPYYPDAHPDHIATHRIAIDARFDAKLSRSGIAGEPHHPKRLIQYYCTHLRTHIVPTFCIDVSDTFEAKMEACNAYQSQGLDREGGLAHYVRDIHAYFGGRIGAEYAEPFHSDELIGLSGLGELM